MLTKTLELCRTGVHGQAGTIVTKNDLDEIVETYTTKSAPVTIWPHALADYAPALGTVDKVWTSPGVNASEVSLFGTVTFNDLLSDAVSKDLFPTWSIGSPRRASDGKRYLHHLKMCGSEPGAVKGLRDLGLPSTIKLSDCPEADTFLLSDPSNSKATIYNDRKEPKEEPMDPLEEAIAAMTDETKKKAAQEAYDALKAKIVALSAKKTAEPGGENPLIAENARLKEQLTKLAAKYPDENIELSDHPSDARIPAIMAQLRKSKKEALLKAAEGKIPKGLESDILALADSLSTQDTISLSDDKEKVSAFDVFEKILASLPEGVIRGEILLSDPTDPSKKINPYTGLMGCV